MIMKAGNAQPKSWRYSRAASKGLEVDQLTSLQTQEGANAQNVRFHQTMKPLLLLSACAFVLGLSPVAFSQDTIKIGEFASLTGDNASFGTSQNEGVKMAAEEINNAGGVLGKKIDPIVEDN